MMLFWSTCAAWIWKFFWMFGRRLCSKGHGKSQVQSMEVLVPDLLAKSTPNPLEEENIPTFVAVTEMKRSADTPIPSWHRRKSAKPLKLLRTKPKYATPDESPLKIPSVLGPSLEIPEWETPDSRLEDKKPRIHLFLEGDSKSPLDSPKMADKTLQRLRSFETKKKAITPKRKITVIRIGKSQPDKDIQVIKSKPILSIKLTPQESPKSDSNAA